VFVLVTLDEIGALRRVRENIRYGTQARWTDLLLLDNVVSRTPVDLDAIWERKNIQRLEANTKKQIAERKRRRDRRLWIYFIEAIDQDLIKIGQSTNIEERLSSLAIGPWELDLLLAVRETDALTESVIHNRFQSIRVKGEWFKDTPDLRRYIAELRETHELYRSES